MEDCFSPRGRGASELSPLGQVGRLTCTRFKVTLCSLALQGNKTQRQMAI